ncbi:regulator of nuclear mRNA [Trichuris trichiura]|uniref:Regulator of nuclear mRNA n=1 Tax=Trichuris trichiura TaxID=36087 RepID=A0A077Z223_TRITR|nr:regulator of nuclear mRNA [Trichuris trichiura]
MSVFTENKLGVRFSQLSSSVQSIQTLSCWIIHHRLHDRKIVDFWLETVRSENRSRRILDLFYLANEVVQNSRKKHPAYVTLFEGVLEEALYSVVKCLNAEHLNKLKRTFDVWEMRKVFPFDFISGLRAIARGEVPTSNWLRRTKDSRSLRRSAGRPTEKDSGYEIPTDEEGIRRVLGGAPSAEEMLAMLELLENSPSADAETRERIAKFPPYLLDSAKIMAMEDPEERNKALKELHEAKVLVDEYNERLSKEMGNRAEIARRLRAFTEEVRRVAEIEGKRHMKMRKNLVKMAKDREELVEHLQSLPETTSAANGDQVKMPTAEELFKR